VVERELGVYVGWIGIVIVEKKEIYKSFREAKANRDVMLTLLTCSALRL